MGRTVDVDDLVNVDVIATRVKRDRSVVDRILTRNDFPVPVVKIGRSNVYLWSEVEPWFTYYETHKPKGGRKADFYRSAPSPQSDMEHLCKWEISCRNKRWRDHPFCRRHWYVWTESQLSP